MVFSSILFIFGFLPVVLLVYSLSPLKYRNHVALAASCFFYMWGAPRFIFVLLGSSLLDYGISQRMGPAGEKPQRARRRLLFLAVSINLAVFFYFKYANFFVGECNRLLEQLGCHSVAWADVALPIGISFFTFQKLSYLVDVYRGEVKPSRSASSYVLYVALFPQLIAGPIVRYHDISGQLQHRDLSADKMLSGIWRFSRGLARKVLIANVMGSVADQSFALGADRLCPLQAWIGAVCYSFQIYFDFSGYSDMAIGLGRMLGFELLENFNSPYISRDFLEFWRRWHISLSSWMREYLYIPLGGNRVSRGRTYVNLWVVFILSGLWHGASWNFVFWGFYHGMFICLARMLGKDQAERVPAVVSVPVTFLLVTVGWVFFRADTLSHALMYLGRMFPLFGGTCAAAVPLNRLLDPHAALILLLSTGFSFAPVFRTFYARFMTGRVSREVTGLFLKFSLALVFLVLSVCALATEKFNPFIYFRF